MVELELRLNCTRCGEFTEYYDESRDNAVVRCEECDKRHSDMSLMMVDPDRRYRRDEAGTLVEDVL